MLYLDKVYNKQNLNNLEFTKQNFNLEPKILFKKIFIFGSPNLELGKNSC